jgi:hypothetical protein
MRRVIFAAVVALAGGAAAQPSSFTYDPKPRWVEDPDTEVVCAAIRAECPAILKDGGIDAEWSYDELYDADGMLVGVRSVKSTGCKPLDEHMELGERHFTQVFTKEGQPDLEGITVELAPGTPKDAVRLVKHGSTQVSMGCST